MCGKACQHVYVLEQKHTVNHPAWIKLLPHTGDIVVAQDGRIKGINSFPRKLCCMSLYSNEINDNSVKGNNSICNYMCMGYTRYKRERK